MEQSREVYETATNQLGSFLELVSNRLTLKGQDTPPPLAPLSVLSDGQRAQGHVSHVSTLSQGSRGSSGVRKRSESENNRRKSVSNVTPGRTGRQGSRFRLEDPSLSPAISCASSSLNTSCASDRSSGVGSSSGPRRTSEMIRFSRSGERKSEVGSEIGSSVTNNDEGAYDISILSSCTCPEDEELPDKEDRRKTSKTKNTLKRITSFMRKDKSKNLSLVDSSPASLKYSRYCHY